MGMPWESEVVAGEAKPQRKYKKSFSLRYSPLLWGRRTRQTGLREVLRVLIRGQGAQLSNASHSRTCIKLVAAVGEQYTDIIMSLRSIEFISLSCAYIVAISHFIMRENAIYIARQPLFPIASHHTTPTTNTLLVDEHAREKIS